MKFISLPALLVLFSACGQVQVKEVKLEPVANEQMPPSPPPPPIDPKILQGSWTDGTTENATFAFTKGGIQYVDNLESYPYSLTSDSIEIRFADYDYKAHISLHNDTLTLTDADGETRFGGLGSDNNSFPKFCISARMEKVNLY